MAAVDIRYEVLPLGKSEEQAAQLPEPVRLTVTCSPKHGPDRSVEVGRRLQALGHTVTVHVAARMVRDRAHLDALLSSMRGAGIDDLFLIGGDAVRPPGPSARRSSSCRSSPSTPSGRGPSESAATPRAIR